jgi:hypothetical protein
MPSRDIEFSVPAAALALDASALRATLAKSSPVVRLGRRPLGFLILVGAGEMEGARSVRCCSTIDLATTALSTAGGSLTIGFGQSRRGVVFNIAMVA